MVGLAVPPQYRWRLLEDRTALAVRLAAELELSPIVAHALANRKIEDSAGARRWLEPSLSQVPDPRALPDFEPALRCLLRAREARVPVLIHGDYDVDGTCGAVLLYRLLRRLELPVSVFVPDRVRDGYSFSQASLQRIRECGARVVIAVDNGTTALQPLGELAQAGVDVIVVDHHRPGPQRPRCTALLNPWCGGDAPFPHFCGTAVAWLLAWGLLRELRGAARLPEPDRRFLVDALGLVALATVADVMPLLGPNRAFVAHGLAALRNSGFPGLRALLEVSGVREQPGADDLAYKLAPRLNAAGRLGQAPLAFELLATGDVAEARRLALRLETLNDERRRIEERELQRLAGAAEAARALGRRVLFLGDRAAHFGVLGIVSNRLMESTGLPALLWAECAPGVARGSARAPEGTDLLALLEGARAHLHGFGGHARAAGFSFDPAQAERIAACLHAAAAECREPPPPTLDIDLEVAPRDLSPRVLRELERLAPFGAAHPRPKFLCTGLRLAAAPRPLGDGRHAALLLERHGHSVRALGFRMAQRLSPLRAGDALDVVFEAGLNQFRGQSAVEWILRDLRSAPA